jgi:adenylate cyclase
VKLATNHTDDLVALNADIVGYSAHIAEDVETTTATMSRYHDLVQSHVESNTGTLANFAGDSFMAVFDEAMSALRAAIAICQEIEEFSAALPTNRRMRFRMGMDQGSVTFADGNHHGDALNIAARIQAISRPGGLAVSGRVYRALDEPALRFRPMGRQLLKNIPEQVDAYEFVDLPSGDLGSSNRASLDLEEPTLAILPPHTEMVDDAVKAAAGMIRRDVIHRLSSLPDLKIVDANPEPGENPDSAVRYLIEFGIHQLDDNVRVFGTLIDLTTLNVVKSHRWTSTKSEMFSLSETIANDLTRSVEVELVVGEPAGLYAELKDPESIEMIYLGWYHLRNDTKQGYQAAIRMFSQVLEKHPESPYGYVLCAFANWFASANQWVDNPAEILETAFQQAIIGENLGDLTGMAQAVQAAVMMSRGNVDEALNRLEQLNIVRPTCDVTYGLEGSIRRYLGQWEQAVKLMDQAMHLTGINKPWYPTVKASSLFVGGRLEEAGSLAEGVLDYQPNNLEALMVLAASQVELGQDRRARATADLIKQRFPDIDVQSWLDKTPYQRREIVDRWKVDLATAVANPTA